MIAKGFSSRRFRSRSSLTEPAFVASRSLLRDRDLVFVVAAHTTRPVIGVPTLRVASPLSLSTGAGSGGTTVSWKALPDAGRYAVSLYSRGQVKQRVETTKTVFMGGVDNKTNPDCEPESAPLLVIDVTAVMGGVDIHLAKAD